jgi:hypothetical protein
MESPLAVEFDSQETKDCAKKKLTVTGCPLSGMNGSLPLRRECEEV